MALDWVKQVIGADISGTWLTKVSSDGTKFLVAQYNGGYVYLGTGNNIWTKADIAGGVSLNVEVCAISGNGQYMLVGEYNGRLYLSVNNGTAWTEIRPSGIDENSDWWGVAINYSGQYMLVGDYVSDSLYFSNDYGVTWTLVNSGDGYADMGTCINDSGSVLIAMGYGGALISTNYGVSWAVKLGGVWDGITGASCTALGDIIYLSVDGRPGIDRIGRILRSSDYGDTWAVLTTTSDVFQNFTTCSDDDSIVLFADRTDGLKSSTDKVNWTTELSAVYDVSSNGSGGVIICGQAAGYVYIATTVPFEFYSNSVVVHLTEPVCFKVLGYPWFDNVQTFRYTNPTSGASPNIITIDNATLVSADIAADVLAKTAEYYNLRYQQDVTLFPDPTIKPVDIRTVSSLYGKRVDGITEKLEGDLTGGYLTATKFVGRERMAS